LLARTTLLAASTGSACHDGHDEAPQVLREMGFAAEVAVGAVRLTLGRHTTAGQIDEAIAALKAAWGSLRRAD
jgi:cysteine desulfurase